MIEPSEVEERYRFSRYIIKNEPSEVEERYRFSRYIIKNEPSEVRIKNH